jgi:hypothetical protein
MNAKNTPETPKRTIEIDFCKGYFDTLKPNQYDKTKSNASIVLDGGYVDLLHTAQSLLSVCRSALMNDEKHYDFDSIDMYRVLGIVSDLLPINEAELLDEIQKQ